MDYQKVGLRVGLEIHQQLNSGTKLFCRCPIMKSESFPLTTTRKIRAVAGETGIVDQAALHAYLQNKTYVYKYHPESSCLVELDDDPPKELNQHALEVGIQIAKMLNSTVVDELHMMRKTVIDGSSVSGFQRTALLATGGVLKTSFGQVHIETVCLEEDAAPPLEKHGETIEYRLDRLGIPLIEIATAPDMHTPEQTKEVAEKIGLLLRSVSVVRGIGSIRQDVNISIESGERIEIKGFQELAKIPSAVDNEVTRQIALLEIKQELMKRGMKTMNTTIHDVTPLFVQTKNVFLQKIIHNNGKVYAGTLEKFAGVLKKSIGDRTFGKELSSYAAVYGLGIMHSDEDLGAYELESEFHAMRKLLGASAEDIIFICAGKEHLEQTMHAIFERALFCLRGVPKETRVADGNGSKFTRPLPGSGRMYPESDVMPLSLTRDYIDAIEKPKTLLEKKETLELPEELKNQIIRSPWYPVFEELAKTYDPVLVATTLLSTLRDLKREGYATETIAKDQLNTVFAAVKHNTISKQVVKDILIGLANGERILTLIKRYTMLSDSGLETIVRDIVSKNPDQKMGTIVGLVLGQTKGRADGKKVAELVKKFLA
ncbi:MAG: Glu-tRNA(Gln) amidotransferase subunit GatE [Candidatus Aenigmarchaeota archaeon]|nr:Glu-tRNA(Gln) amidotransferase subunit GatE [Candidatus Aenigmarchaeota archaeon]